MIDTIIFDLEGVIIDTEPLWDAANRRFLARYGVVYDRAAIKPLIAGRSMPDGTDVIRETYNLAEDLEELVAERRRVVEMEIRKGAGLIPGFLRFHESLGTSRKSCVATSMDRELLTIVDGYFGLSALFHGNVFSAADVGYVSKPDPALFLYAAERMGSEPTSCLVIEDAPNGIMAARNAGMRCIGLATTFEPELLSAADVVVRSFDEIDLAAM